MKRLFEIIGVCLILCTPIIYVVSRTFFYSSLWNKMVIGYSLIGVFLVIGIGFIIMSKLLK